MFCVLCQNVKIHLGKFQLSLFSGLRLSWVLINAVDEFEGFKFWKSTDNNLDTKNWPLFQNLELLLVLIC